MQNRCGGWFVDGGPPQPLGPGKLRLLVTHGSVTDTTDFDDDYDGLLCALNAAAKFVNTSDRRLRSGVGPSPRLRIEYFEGRRIDHARLVDAVECLNADLIHDGWELKYISPAIRESGGR